MISYRMIILVSLAGFVSCQSGKNETEIPENETFCISAQLKKSTVIVDVVKQPIKEQLALSGKIEYNENDLVAYKSLLEGIVENVRFELGDYVAKGQVLATVRSSHIQELIQQKYALQNQIKMLEQSVQTQTELLNDGMIARSELLETQNNLSSAQIELNRINQNFELFQAGANGKFHITAPKTGYIIQKNISAGQTLTSDNELLFSISNLKQVWVMVNIYAGNLRYVKVGDEVQVKTVAYPDEVYQGKIDKIYNVFDDNEHVLKARVVLENQHLNLMPGLSAEILIDKGTSSGEAFAVPNKAKVFNNNKEYVVVYKDDCDLQIRNITSVAVNEEVTYVQEMFSENEKVVATNALLLFEELNR